MKNLFILVFVALACSPSSEKAEEKVPKTIEKKTFTFAGVTASNQFDGARLNDFIQLSEKNFQATISPENIPVNASAWFSFKIWSDEKKAIQLSLKYTHHKHRFIPKFSSDGKRWNSFEGQVALNRDSTMATFNVTVSPDTLWVSAQEVFSAKSTYDWIDSFIASKSFISKKSAGKSLLDQDVFVLSSESEETKSSAVLVARQHPPEVPGGSIAFKAFFENIMSESDLAASFREKFNLYVFPLINPDGADLGNWRHNANGVDLNRDWEDFTQPETRIVRDFVTNKVEQEGKSISFGIDFHTSYSGPYLLILDSANEANMKTRIIPNWIEGVGDDPLNMNDYRRRDQALPYCYNWFYNALGAEAVTLEEGDEIDRDTIRARATLYADKWMESMLATK
ncbi:MAG: M14 family metallopeptidase [Cyclobacteriaceae bacterium]